MSKKSGKKSKIKRKDEPSSATAMLITQALLVLLPLYVHNRYFDIIDAKANLLSFLSILALLLIFISCLITKAADIRKANLNGLDISVFALAITAVLSCAFSDDFGGSFRGLYGWRIGGFLLLSFAIIYFYLSRNLSLTKKQCLPALIVACSVSLLSAAHSMGADIFNLHSGIAGSQYYLYKSTLGNLNAHVGYVCLLFPAGLVVFADERNRKHLIYEAIFMLAMLIEIVFACSDGVYIGIGLCAFAAIPFLLQNGQRLRRVFALAAVFGIMLFISGQLSCFAESAAANGGLTEQLRKAYISLPISAVGMVGYAVLYKYPDLLKKDKLRNACILTAELALICAVLYFFRDSVQNFSDTWGTNRGKIWRISLESFAQLSPMHKVFGVGPELQQLILCAEWERKLPVYVCHSEPVQLLLSMGIAGASAWLAVCASVIVSAIRRKVCQSREVVLALPLLAYLGQSLVNSAMATNVGIMCVVLACYRRYAYGEKDTQKKNPKRKRKKK